MIRNTTEFNSLNLFYNYQYSAGVQQKLAVLINAR